MTRMFNPPHPARMLAENLEYLGISASQFARHIGVAPVLSPTSFERNALLRLIWPLGYSCYAWA